MALNFSKLPYSLGQAAWESSLVLESTKPESKFCSKLLLLHPFNMQITSVTPACWVWGKSGIIALEKTITGHNRAPSSGQSFSGC